MRNRTPCCLCPVGYVFLGALVSWGSVHANPRAYGPLGSTQTAPDCSWALEAVGRAASFPSGAGRDRTGENVGLSPRRVKSQIPLAAGRRHCVVPPPLARGRGVGASPSPRGEDYGCGGRARVYSWANFGARYICIVSVSCTNSLTMFVACFCSRARSCFASRRQLPRVILLVGTRWSARRCTRGRRRLRAC